MRSTILSLTACFLVLIITACNSLSQENNAVPESLKIVISDGPKTIDPSTILPKYLSQEVSVDFKEWTLLEFVDWIENTTEKPVVLDKVSLNKAGMDELELVTDSAKKEPVYLLLQRVLENYPQPLSFYTDDGILYITTKQQAESKLFSETYNLSDLLDAGYETMDIQETIVTATSCDWFDESGEGGTMQFLGDVLLVRANQQVQREIDSILKALTKHGKQTFLFLPEQHLSLDEKMGQHVSVDFSNMPLAKVIDSLEQQTKLPIRFDKNAFRAANISQRKPVKLRLKNVRLRTVLGALVATEPTTVIAQNGVLTLTTQEKAKNILSTALYDVRDLCRNEGESAALTQAIQNQTSGGWKILGNESEGVITSPKPGCLVIRQTMHIHREILELLTIYRKALSSSKPPVKKAIEEDKNRVITHYYKMPTVMAEGLVTILPKLVAPKSWKTTNEKKHGEIFIVRSESKALEFGETEIQEPQSVLIVKQTKANQLLVSEVITRIKTGDGEFSADPESADSGGMGGGGGFGGGFFSVED